jgi:hypothetical protein
VDAPELKAIDRSIYVEAVKLLRPTGQRLDAAAAQLAEAIRLLGDSGTVLEAVRFFLKHHSVAIPKKSVPDIYEEFRLAKRADGLAVRYLQDIRSRLGRFSRKFTGRISEITTTEMETGWQA